METWKSLPGYEGIYEISDLGNLKRIALWSNRNRTHGLMHPRVNYLGYAQVNLKVGDKYKTFLMHRLVALTFLGQCPENHCVNHINGIRHDNRAANLEYLTQSDNLKHSYRVLGVPTRQGSKHPLAKLDEDKVLGMHQMRSKGASIKEIAFEFSVSYETVAGILRGQHWRHVQYAILNSVAL